jgi:hypothetical protein
LALGNSHPSRPNEVPHDGNTHDLVRIRLNDMKGEGAAVLQDQGVYAVKWFGLEERAIRRPVMSGETFSWLPGVTDRSDGGASVRL